jgi:regulator of RNase E activity RraA
MDVCSDAFFDAIAKGLNTSVLSDLLDQLGHRDQVLSSSIRPIDDKRPMVGRARTARYRELHEVPKALHSYDLLIQFIDDLHPHEIAVTACGDAGRVAVWGELLTTAAKARGAAGFLTDGFVRDIEQIRRMAFPLFCSGVSPTAETGRGAIAEVDIPVECGGVSISPGALIIADADGVIVVPKQVEDEVLKRAFEKAAGESRTRQELERGVKLAEVFAKVGVL